MDNVAESTSVATDLRGPLQEAQEAAREQLTAAWQLHVDRVREHLETGWRDQVERVLADRFGEMQRILLENFDRTLEQRVDALLASRQEEQRVAAEKQITEQLNQIARRLQNSDGREAWIATLLEAASRYCARAALFRVNGEDLSFEGGLEVGEDRGAEFTAASAPAFGSAIESKDTVIAIATRRELSDAVVDLFGGAEGHKVFLFPIVLRGQVVGVLYAAASEKPVEVAALELITALAVQSMVEEEVTVQEPPAELIGITGIALPPPNIANTEWSLLPKADQEIHLRAQRLARRHVAQLLLFQNEQVRAGRAGKDLYAKLKEEIDAGRQAFREQFMAACPSMVDYYHVELVGTLAQNDNTLLGADYPGPLP